MSTEIWYNIIMKKIIAIISIISTLLYAGCAPAPKHKVDKQGRPVAVQMKTDKTDSAAEKNCYYVKFDCLSVKLKYVMFDGHEYIFARSNRGIGITHSPRCECKNDL